VRAAKEMGNFKVQRASTFVALGLLLFKCSKFNSKKTFFKAYAIPHGRRMHQIIPGCSNQIDFAK
jgi:hypothetical protein